QQYIPTTLPPTNPQLNLAGPADAAAFSPNGAFAFVAESAANGGSANITAFATCNNQIPITNPVIGTPGPAVLNLPADPIAMKVLPNVHLSGTDSSGNTIPDGIHLLVLDGTGFDIVTSTVSDTLACPQSLTFVSNPPGPTATPQRIELGPTINTQDGSPNLFASADGTLLYVVNPGSSSILVYNFLAGATTGGIEILGNATPLSADMSSDAGTIVVVGSDGLLHEISTGIGGADLFQLPFPNLPNFQNPFCTFTPTAGPCTLNVALVKP